jgi:thiamine pyrophosphate-dependent acetolactate synthase large subunit-like protein
MVLALQCAPVFACAASPARPTARVHSVADAVRLLKAAQRPLLIVGKGAAYSGAEKEVQQLANRHVCVHVRKYVCA